MTDKAFYEFRAPKYVEFEPKFGEKQSAYFDFFNNSGDMDIDLSIPLPSEPGFRWSSTPNKRDSCTQTPTAESEKEENNLSEALDTMLSLDRPNRRSVRFNDAVDVFPKTPNSSYANGTSANGDKSDSNTLKRQTTPTTGQTWHQALKYRSVEQRVATPRVTNRSSRGSIADPTLKVGTGTGTPQTPRQPKTVYVKVRVDPKPVVKVEPFKLTEYKPRKSPLPDPVNIFQKNTDTPIRQSKTAVRRIPAEEQTDSPKTPFRARPPASLYKEPFVPKLNERRPIKQEPFKLHTEERAKKREEYDLRVQQHLLELEAERRRQAAEREREEALELKELRKVKIHAKPVPAFVYSPVQPKTEPKTEPSPKPSLIPVRQKRSI